MRWTILFCILMFTGCSRSWEDRWTEYTNHINQRFGNSATVELVHPPIGPFDLNMGRDYVYMRAAVGSDIYYIQYRITPWGESYTYYKQLPFGIYTRILTEYK